MILRSYQEKLVRGLAEKIYQGKRKIIAQLATGGGKTVCFSAITARYIAKQTAEFLKTNPEKNVIILVHRKELLQQTRKTLYNEFSIEATAIKAGSKFLAPARVYVGMIESVNRRISRLPHIGMVIIDEAHIASFNKIHDHFPDQIILGFTATPYSSNKRKPLKMYYDDIVCGVDVPELIELNQNHPGEGLCQNITRAPKETVDRLTLAVKGNDFDDRNMSETFSKVKYINNTVVAYEKWGLGEKTIIFNVNISHSIEVNKAFVEKGYNARHLDSEMSAGERDDIITWFKNTPDAILNNVGIATVGFDEPSIRCVIVNKATMSMPLWLQMCGRGSRPIKFIKDYFTIIDMGGNAITHGDWCQARDWEDLFFFPQKPAENGVAPVKSCPQCEGIVPAGCRVCTLTNDEDELCGYIWPDRSIPVEVDLNEFIVVTKNIDVDQIIRDNAHKKEYYPFFEIGREIAFHAKKTVPKMSDDYANFILLTYFDRAKQWMKSVNEINKTKHGEKRKAFNQWHQTTAREFLFTELQKHFTEWQPSILSATINQ